MSQSVSLNHAKPDAADLVAAARRLGAIIRDRRNESERERGLPATVLLDANTTPDKHGAVAGDSVEEYLD